MDPFQTTMSCLGALQVLYEAYDEAEYTFENAKRLMKTCDVLEVTLNMIPRRAKVETVLADTDNLQQKDIESNDVTLQIENKPKSGEVLRESTQSPGMEACLPMICGGNAKSNIFEDDAVRKKGEKSNGTILNELRSNGGSDLDITYAGIAFLIKSATEVIEDATKVFMLAKKPNMSWILTPWKFVIQRDLEFELAEQMTNLLNFTQQLQAAINVASYAVQMQSLENALDATNVLSHPSIKQFWKQRIGIDKTRANIKEVYEAFLDDQEGNIQKYYHDNKFLITKKNGKKIDPQIAIRRFLEKEWNSNGDDVITVYELAKVANEMVEKASKRKQALTNINLVEESFKECIIEEKRMMRLIQFNVFDVKFEGGTSSIVEVNKRNILSISPFSRINCIARIPQFDKDLFPFDCLTVMKYDDDTPPLSGKFTLNHKQHMMKEVFFSRTYIHREVNKRIHEKDTYKWNAPNKFSLKDKSNEWKDSFELKGEENFQKFPKPILNVEEGDIGKHKDDSIQKMMSIMYTPLFMKPGWYTLRYCLEDIDSETWCPDAKDFKVSEKSFYYNRLRPEEPEEEKITGNPQASGAGEISTVKPTKRASMEGRRASLLEPTTEKARDERIQRQMGEGCILIEVQDQNTIVWAETYENDDDDSDDEDDEKEGGGGGKNWRPKAPVSFPILPESQTKARFYEEEHGYFNDDEPCYLGFYVHTEKAKKQKNKAGETEKFSPLEIGYFVGRKEITSDKKEDDDSSSDFNDDDDEDDASSSSPSGRRQTTKPVSIPVDLDVPTDEEGCYKCKWTMPINKERPLQVIDINSEENKRLKESLIVQSKEEKGFFAFVKPTGKLLKAKGNDKKTNKAKSEEQENEDLDSHLDSLKLLDNSPQLEYYLEEMEGDVNDDDSSSWGFSSSDESDWSDDSEDIDNAENRDIGDINHVYRIGEQVYYYDHGWEEATIIARREFDSDNLSTTVSDSDDELSNMTPESEKSKEKYVYDITYDEETISDVSAKDLFKFYPQDKEVELQLAPDQWFTGRIREPHEGFYAIHKIYCEVEITDDCNGQKDFYEDQLADESDGYLHISNIRPKKPQDLLDPEYPVEELEPLDRFTKQQLFNMLRARNIHFVQREKKDELIAKLRNS